MSRKGNELNETLFTMLKFVGFYQSLFTSCGPNTFESYCCESLADFWAKRLGDESQSETKLRDSLFDIASKTKVRQIDSKSKQELLEEIVEQKTEQANSKLQRLAELVKQDPQGVAQASMNATQAMESRAAVDPNRKLFEESLFTALSPSSSNKSQGLHESKPMSLVGFAVACFSDYMLFGLRKEAKF